MTGTAIDETKKGSGSLTAAQRAALRHVTEHSISRSAAANQQIDEILRMSNMSNTSKISKTSSLSGSVSGPIAGPISGKRPTSTVGSIEEKVARSKIEGAIEGAANDRRARFEAAIDEIKTHARVALHFHPDRPAATGQNVAQSLLNEGVYRSQFETGISNGGLSAHPGGARQRWEDRLFGGAYESSNACEKDRAHERPKYGALDVMRHSDGPSPRFGSCYFLLKPGISHRCTLTYMDSSEEPEIRGTLEAFDDIVSSMLGDVFKSDFTLGENNLTPPRLVDHILEKLRQPLRESVAQPANRNLNHYIEAQVHGELSLAEDVEALVIDPCFANTDVGEILETLCDRYDIALFRHGGFALSVDEVPSDIRGPSMPSLAARIAKNETIDAGMIGQAVTQLKSNPAEFSNRGSQAEVLQELKLLWHVLVRVGRPAREFEPGRQSAK